MSGSEDFGQSTLPVGLTGVLAIVAGTWQSLALFSAPRTNQPPIATPYSFGAWRDRPNTLGIGSLLRACTDPDGDSLSVTSVSAASSAGGIVVLSGASWCEQSAARLRSPPGALPQNSAHAKIIPPPGPTGKRPVGWWWPGRSGSSSQLSR